MEDYEMIIDFEDRDPTPTRLRTKIAFWMLALGVYGMFASVT